MASMANPAERSGLQRGSVFYIPKTVSDILMQVLAMPNNLKRICKLNYYINVFENEITALARSEPKFRLSISLLKEGLEMLKKERMHCKEREEGKKWVMLSPQLWTTPIQYKKTLDNVERNYTNLSLKSGSKLLRMNEEENGISSRGGAKSPYLLSMISVQAEEDLRLQRSGEGPEQQQQKKKKRRCWSPELHQKFVEALQRLGGPKNATPKQIRAFMKVEGLTNDEVKSHLQKYRLHIKKLPRSLVGTSGYSWLSIQDESRDLSKRVGGQE